LQCKVYSARIRAVFAINFHDGASDWPFKHFNLKSLTDIGYVSARR